MNLNLLSRYWWDGLSFNQVKQALDNSRNYICLYGCVSNVTFDQTADFEILCRFTWGTIKLNLTSLAEKEALIDLLDSRKYSVWIKGKVTSFPVLMVCVKKWGFDWNDLLISKSLEYDLEVTYETLSDDARKWVNTLESSTNPRVKKLLEWWYWQGSEDTNLFLVDNLKFWGRLLFLFIRESLYHNQSGKISFFLKGRYS